MAAQLLRAGRRPAIDAVAMDGGISSAEAIRIILADAKRRVPGVATVLYLYG